MQETPKWQRSGLTHGVLYMVIHFKRLACSGRRHRYSHLRSPIYRRYTSIMKCIAGTTGRLVELIRYWQDQWTPTAVMITHTIYSFIFYPDIIICYACLLMLLYFIMRFTIVTHDTYTALNSHQHVVLSPGLVTHQMQSTLETSILDIQIRRDRATRGSDRRSAGVFHYPSVVYVYVGHCPVLFS